MTFLLLLIGCQQATWCERFNLACELEGEVVHEDVVDLDGDVWTAGEDCNDLDEDIHPSAQEICDGTDNDCDLQIDEGTPGMQTWYYDEDGDGYGLSTNTVVSCDQPPGFAVESGDCDDSNTLVNPARVEICDNGIDEDCDASANECGLFPGLPAELAERYLREAVQGESLGTSVAMAGRNPSTATLLVGDPGWGGSGGAWGTGVYTLQSTAANGSVERLSWFIRTNLESAELGAAIAETFDSEVAPAFAVGAPGAGLDADGEGAVVITAGNQPHQYEIDQGSALITGASAGRRLGAALASVGDVDGDDVPDLVMGAPGDQAGSGSVALLLMPVSGRVELGDTDLWLRDGPAGGGLGTVLHGGDLDGDGLGELVLGSPGEGAGVVRVGFAPHDMGQLPVADLALALDGEHEGDAFGSSAVVATDLDGDGIDDLVIGAPGAEEGAGAAWFFPGGEVVHARAGRIAVGEAPARFDGENPGDAAGSTLDGGGDVDGDGSADLVVGASGYTPAGGHGQVLGIAYVITGRPSGNLDLSVSDGSVIGLPGSGLGGPGTARILPDIDGNGLDELSVGSPGLDLSTLGIFLPQGS